MTPVLMSFLLLFTILVSFSLGIALGYWVVCGILNFFNPSRPRKTPNRRPTFAASPSGD
ncbi:MAG TPA: hypothetical protein VE779_11900 [Candidatus Angelobacter sp.]|nr:hypothetical protein [Candidatus Angelobacter sp.]